MSTMFLQVLEINACTVSKQYPSATIRNCSLSIHSTHQPLLETATMGNLKIATMGNLKIATMGNLKTATMGNLKTVTMGNLKTAIMGN